LKSQKLKTGFLYQKGTLPVINYPPDDARVCVIDEVVPAAALSTAPWQSDALRKLKALLEARRRK
jgi:hypothetical protein